jgi:hypothetical protein
MVHGDYGKIHAGNSENFRVWPCFVTEFGILRLFFLYRSGQVHPDISTMIDKGVCFIDYFPLYRLFWGLFSTIKHLPVNENTVFCWLSVYIGQVWFITSNS